MKKLFFVLIFLCISVFANAQKHLVFNDIEINGSTEAFVEQLIQKGFTTIIKQPTGNYMMAGKYLDTDGMLVVIGSTTTKDIIGVCYMCASQETFSQTTSLYFKMKDDLAKVYGYNSYSIEGKTPNEVELDNLHMEQGQIEQLDKTDGIYCTIFRQDIGNVYLTISYVENIGSVVMIYYEDAINSQILEEEASVSDDIVKGHLEIMGIPLDGNIKDFESELLKKGFIKADSYSYIKRNFLYNGLFTGRDVTLGIGTTNTSLTVFKAFVMFKPSDSWETLIRIYDDLKRSYIMKYGDPLSVEKFESPYDHGNTLKIYALEKGKGEYYSIWRIGGCGYIMLKIDFLAYGYANVIVSYEDEANGMVLERERMGDI